MGMATQGLVGSVSMVFVCGTVGLLTPTDSKAEFQFKKKQAFPQTPLVKKLFKKTVCGFRNSKARFVTSKDGKYVCDRTTGEIWEQDPDSYDMTTNPDGRMERNWDDAKTFCANLGKAMGHGQVYELPSVQQLQNLLDYAFFQPALTPDVFEGFLSSSYWSATLIADTDPLAWIVFVDDGNVSVTNTADLHFVWCVRRDKAAHADW